MKNIQYNEIVIIQFSVQYGIFLDSSNMTFQVVYSSKYIPVLYSKMYNNL